MKESSRLNGAETSMVPHFPSQPSPHIKISTSETSYRVVTVSLRRKALSAYTFFDGLHIPSGSVVCVPLRAMARDHSHFTDPDSFDGYRFLKTPPGTRGTGFTETSTSLPLWGFGKETCQGFQFTLVRCNHWQMNSSFDAVLHAWQNKLTPVSNLSPGRFYAATVLKTALVHILRNYDIRLVDARAPKTFSWRSTILPRDSPLLLLRRRAV